jgi:FAD/FMN-containing dehydrogenase
MGAGGGELAVRNVVRGSEEWEAACQAYNLAVAQNPEMVAFPSSADEVSAVVRHARERGFTVAAQRTGHNAEPLGSLDGVVLLNTRELHGVQIDGDARSARVAGGAQWHDIVPPASDLGLAALHGSAPDIGIAGYCLGGGIGWYARKLGLACNRVTAIELVDGEGQQRRVDADNESELFWALRGGGGNFGIVTALEFDLVPVPEVYAGVLFFDFDRSAEVLHAWHEWLPSTPDEATTVGRMMQFPPLPEIPEPMRGNSYALIEMVFMGSEKDGAELLAPLRELGPAVDTFAMVPPAALAELHMDPPEPLPYHGDHLLLNDVDEAAIDAFVATGGPESGTSLISMELRQLGGALGRAEPGAGALPKVDAEYLFFAVGMKDGPESGDLTEGHVSRMTDALAPFDAGCRYLNFAERHGDATDCWHADDYARLQRARAAYDPDGIFRANHAIVPSA